MTLRGSRLARTPVASEPWFGERVMPGQLPTFGNIIRPKAERNRGSIASDFASASAKSDQTSAADVPASCRGGARDR